MNPAPNLGLGEKQRIFSHLVGLLLLRIGSAGYECSLGEAWRTPEQAQIDAEKGTGIANSVHCVRLAIDINLFKDGVYLPNTSDHAVFGEWWKQQHPLCRWGGDFKDRPDGNHYSMEHEGVQ